MPPPEPQERRESGSSSGKSSAVRKTQRVPKTCTSCARKKIKCDKVIPCHPCIERGEAHLCAREVVLVKGLMRNVEMTDDANALQQFVKRTKQLETENAELLKQVSSLQKLVLELRHQSTSPPSEVPTPHLPSLNGLVSSATASPEASINSPSMKSDVSVNHYANALQYLTIGIIDEENADSPEEYPAQRTKLVDNIPAFSRKPLGAKDKKPFCPSCSIGEMSHCFAARLPFDNGNTQKIFLSLAFELPKITRKQSTIIIQYALECLNFLHCSVHPPSFYLEHDFFWDSDQPKTLEYAYDRTRGQYLWAAIWYAELCLGTFYADDNLIQRLGREGMDEATLKVIPHMFFAAALECLHRGEMYKFPDIRSVQVFCILGPCYQAFSGINLRNCLLNTMVYISQRLNLDKIASEETLNIPSHNEYRDLDAYTRLLDRELGRRIWWSVINSDWLDSTGRASIISPSSFTTVEPGNFNDSDLLEYIDEDKSESTEAASPYSLEVFTASSFHIYMSRLATIKRKYYFDKCGWIMNSQIDNLLTAIDQLNKLEDSLPIPLRHTNNKFSYGNYELQSLSLQRYLIHIATAFERLTINRTMAVYVTQIEWNTSCRQACLDSAHDLLMSCSTDAPLVFKKHPMVSGNGIAAAVYVLLDLLDHGNQDQITERLKWVEEFLPSLRILQSFHSQARRGINIITKLTTAVLLQAEESKPKKGGRKRQAPPSEPAPSLYEILQRLTMLPRVSTAPALPRQPQRQSNFVPEVTPEIKIEEGTTSDFNNMLQPPFMPTQPAFYEPTAYNQPPQSPQEHFIQGMMRPPEMMPEQMPIPLPDAGQVTYEDLEIMCGLTNQDWDTSVVNFSADFDFDMNILQRPPTDCPDDV